MFGPTLLFLCLSCKDFICWYWPCLCPALPAPAGVTHKHYTPTSSRWTHSKFHCLGNSKRLPRVKCRRHDHRPLVPRPPQDRHGSEDTTALLLQFCGLKVRAGQTAAPARECDGRTVRPRGAPAVPSLSCPVRPLTQVPRVQWMCPCSAQQRHWTPYPPWGHRKITRSFIFFWLTSITFPLIFL